MLKNVLPWGSTKLTTPNLVNLAPLAHLSAKTNSNFQVQWLCCSKSSIGTTSAIKGVKPS